MPKFATEAEEAAWWHDHRQELGEAFVKGQPKRVEAGPVSRLRERRAEAKASTEKRKAQLSRSA